MGQIQDSFNMNLVFDVLTGSWINTHFPVKAGKHYWAQVNTLKVKSKERNVVA